MRRHIIYVAASRDDVDNQSRRLAAMLRSASGFAWTYNARPDLTHATIFRALAPAGLASVLR
jgi:hypothetical protein